MTDHPLTLPLPPEQNEQHGLWRVVGRDENRHIYCPTHAEACRVKDQFNLAHPDQSPWRVEFFMVPQ